MKVFGREYRAAKRFVEGTHRVCSPRETLAAHVPKMKAMGITRLADVTGLDFIGLPVYMAVRPNSRGLAVSQGKGLDREAAKAGALMESIEGWHAERIAAPLRHESYAALRRAERVVNVTRLPLERGARLELNTPRLWIEGHDLLAGGAAWVPFECVTTNFVRTAYAGRTFTAGSNGLASGNHLLEAVAHGLCELIERDAATLWRRSTAAEQQQSQVNLATVESPRCRTVLDKLRRAGVETVVWDATGDTGVPTFVCRIRGLPRRGALGAERRLRGPGRPPLAGGGHPARDDRGRPVAPDADRRQPRRHVRAGRRRQPRQCAARVPERLERSGAGLRAGRSRDRHVRG